MSNSAEPALAKTTGYLAYGEQYLYVGVRCQKPLMQNLTAIFAPGPSQDQVYTDDCVEIYVDPGRTRQDYVRLVVNPKGAYKTTGEAKWDWVCGTTTDSWIAEVSLSLDSLSSQPASGEVWGLNIARNDHAGTEERRNQLSTWAAAYHTFHNPGLFGMLVFE